MKILFFILAFLLSIPQISKAQIITFDKSFDSIFQDQLNDVVQTTDGGYVAIGSTRGFSLSPGIANIYVRKYNQFGDTIWTKAIGDTTWMYRGAIQQTNDGGYIISGSGQNPINGAYLAKLDQSGTIVWQKWLGNGIGFDLFNSVKQNADGSYTAVGSTRRSNNSDSTTYVYLAKVSATGNTIWNKTFRQAIGGQYIGQEVYLTSDGGYFITANKFNGSGGVYESWLIKTDGQGVLQWTKSYPKLEAASGKQTVDGGYIVAGKMNPFSGSNTGTNLFKLNSVGDTVWTKRYPGLGANSVVQTSDGGYAFTGSILADTVMYGAWPAYFQNLLAIKTDGAGAMRFMRTYGDTIDDAGYSIKQTTDGGYVIAGVKDWVFAVGVGPLQPGPDKGLLLKINFTAQDAVLAVPKEFNNVISFQLYPNPATSKSTISIPHNLLKSEQLHLRVTNVLGEEVLLKKLDRKETTFERGDLKSGVYLVQLINSDTGKIRATKKLILN